MYLKETKKEYIIHKNTSLREVIKKLDENSDKILYLVDDEDKLYGSFTDGDFRRWIISKGDLNCQVQKACNRNVLCAKPSDDKREILRILDHYKIFSIPIVNQNNEILEIFSLKFSKKPINTGMLKNISVVIMAGGFGTRLKPFTTILPKPLIPIGDKSMLEIIMNNFYENGGANKFILTLNHKAELIRAYLRDSNLDFNISFVKEKIPLGTAGSLSLIDKNNLSDNFFLTNCDIIIESNYEEVLNYHNTEDNDITIIASLISHTIPYGVCELDNSGYLREINEKPILNYLISTGMYVIKKDCLNEIKKGEIYHMTNLIEDIKNKGGKIGVFPISENSLMDTGQWEEYTKTLKRLTIN